VPSILGEGGYIHTDLLRAFGMTFFFLVIARVESANELAVTVYIITCFDLHHALAIIPPFLVI
jgi:hypothetical protein